MELAVKRGMELAVKSGMELAVKNGMELTVNSGMELVFLLWLKAKPRLACVSGRHPHSETPVGVLPWTCRSEGL